jgi:hypothetical protein
MSAFDAPSRETCTVQRESTNTPLQALVLLNDPTFVEAARTLAVRVLREKKESRDRVVRLFRHVTGRRPSAAEIAIFIDAERRERARFREDPAAARALVTVGESSVDPGFDPIELAAWTQLATIILNLSETITKG